MTQPTNTNVVTLSLSQGESPNPTATFTSAMAARQVILGSGPAAHWKVRGHGVEASHLELYWDGKVLWVRDGGSLSGVYVGVDRAEDWQQIFDGAEVYFGQAVIRATVSGPDAREKSATGPINPKAAAFIDEASPLASDQLCCNCSAPDGSTPTTQPSGQPAEFNPAIATCPRGVDP